MTAWFDKIGSETGDSTRTHGDFRFRDPCLNWLSASTETWYVKTIGRDDLISGFGARILQIFARKDYGKRMPFMKLPADRDVVLKHLRDRVAELILSQGPMYFSLPAQKLYSDWYQARVEPEDDAEKPVWNRIPVLSLKVAMISCLAKNKKQVSSSGETFWLLGEDDILEGIGLVAEVWKSLPKIKGLASSTPQTLSIKTVATLIERGTEKKGFIDHSTLIKRARDKGLHAHAVKQIISHLANDEGLVVYDKSESGKGLVYKWKDALPY
jgi:hypothetical protein